MYAAVCHELVQGEASYFAAHGVESGKHYRLGGVVDNDFYAGGCFESADVAAFATDDAAFYFVGVDVEYCHGVFNGSFGSHTLYALHHDAFRFLVGGHLGIVHDVVDVACGGCLGFVLERFDEFFFRFLAGESADMLKLFLGFASESVEFGFLRLYAGKLFVKPGFCLLDAVAFALVVALLLVELNFALLYFAFGALNLGEALVCRFFCFGFYAYFLFACFKQFVFLDYFRFFAGFGNDGFRAALREVSLNHYGGGSSCHKGYYSCNYQVNNGFHLWILYLWL